MRAELVLLSALIGSFPAEASAENKNMTLEEALSLASGENLQIKTSAREVDASDARLSRATSNFLPRLGLESRFESFESTFQKQSGATGNLFLEWNVFDGFRSWYDRKAKRFESEQAQIGFEKQKLAIRADVEAKFYKLLGVVESIKSYEEALKRNESQQESAKRRRSAGLSSDADILEFGLYQTELQAELARLKSEFKQVQAEFREILGQRNQEAEIIPQGNLTHYHVDESLVDLKSRLAKESQSLISARYALEQAEANQRVAFGGYLPKLDIKVTYGSRGINETVISPETAVMGTARWELFSGFDTFQARGEAAAVAAKAEAALRQTELSANTQVETSYTALKTIQDRVDIEAKNKVNAGKFFEVVTGEYKRGVKNSTDVRAAAQLLLQALLRDIQYRSDFFEQKALLEKAIGGSVKTSKGSLHGHTD